MKRTRKGIQCSRVGQVGVRKSRADQVYHFTGVTRLEMNIWIYVGELTSSMGRGITTLVITVDGDVQTQILSQVLIVAISEHVDVVACRYDEHGRGMQADCTRNLPTRSRSLLIPVTGVSGLYTLR